MNLLKTTHEKRNTKPFETGEENNTVFLYIGTLFFLITSISIGVLILMFFLLYAEKPF